MASRYWSFERAARAYRVQGHYRKARACHQRAVGCALDDLIAEMDGLEAAS